MAVYQLDSFQNQGINKRSINQVKVAPVEIKSNIKLIGGVKITLTGRQYSSLEANWVLVPGDHGSNPSGVEKTVHFSF